MIATELRRLVSLIGNFGAISCGGLEIRREDRINMLYVDAKLAPRKAA